MIRSSSLSAVAGSGTAPAVSYSTPLWTSRVTSPPSSRIMFGPSPSGHASACSEHHQYSSSVSPFQAKTGTPASAIAAAAWSWVEKMLQEHQRTSAPRARQRLDQHRGLDRHVQRAGDARALERLRVGELGAGRHQAGHLVLGELDLLAAERREREVGDLVVGRRWRWGSCNLREGVGVGRAGAGASPAPSAASWGRGRRSGRSASGLEPVVGGGAQRGRRCAAAARRPGRRARCRARRAARAGCAGAAARPGRRGGSRTPSERARRARRARRSAACAATSPWSPPPR